MYEHSSHSSFGWSVMALALALNVVDVGRFLLRSTRLSKALVAKLCGCSTSRVEDVEPVFQLGDGDDDGDETTRLVHSPASISFEHEGDDAARWTSIELEPRRNSSRGQSFSDEETVIDAAGPEPLAFEAGTARSDPLGRWRKIGARALDFAQRMLVLLGYVELCTGVAVWTGTCRARYLNGCVLAVLVTLPLRSFRNSPADSKAACSCLAHVIKGSIFLWYGLLTFARYCGAFSSLGWAWNRHPSRTSTFWTAEFVESAVITLYGSTNVWMERFGKTGAWSVKDVQVRLRLAASSSLGRRNLTPFL